MRCTELYYTQLGDCWCSSWKLAQTAALQHAVSTYMISLHPTMNGSYTFFPIGLDLKTVILKHRFPCLSSDFSLKRTLDFQVEW